MGIIDRIKRRLPIVSASAPPRPAGSPPSPPPSMYVAPEEEKSARGDKPVREYIDETLAANKIVLFMKGTPNSPQCGFSASAAGILQQYGKPLATVNVIADPEVREGVKEYTSWPTIPQVFVGGEFVGGADILRQMHESGELKQAIDKAYGA